MKFSQVTKFVVSLLILFRINSLSAENIHHEIKAEIQPERHFIKVTDEITLPADFFSNNKKEIHFLLHGDLKITSQTKGMKIKQHKGEIDSTVFGVTNTISIPREIPIRHYSFKAPKKQTADFKLTISYEGEIFHPIEQQGEEYARGFSETPGIIDTSGAMLAGSTWWLPWFNEDLVKFNLELTLPGKWDAVSQGRRTRYELVDGKRVTRWESPEIMDEVYLIAAPFTEYSRQVGSVVAMAFLRTPDEALANKYLETTTQYVEMYNQLIGPYPYAKFALVENFWETGYGMPSFTLLGPKVIRFPWILHSSYPHEILHNWWGNSVFVDYEAGNWCEGLTVYLADHLIKEQRGEAATYRRDALQAYTDYVKGSKDFPLTQFRSRHDAATSAVGYNKSMFVYHQLRCRFGDEVFTKAIQQFYRQYKFKKATFNDIQSVFEDVTGEQLDWFFKQWIERTGSPQLALSEPKVEKVKDGFKVSFTLNQQQMEEAYRLLVPVAVTVPGEKEALVKQVELTQKQQSFSMLCPAEPQRIDVDPEFDVFRRLDRNEIPPALSQVFGAEKATIILPDSKKDNMFPAYKELAEIWGKSEQISSTNETELSEMPSGSVIWLFGKQNKFLPQLQDELSAYQLEILLDKINFTGKEMPYSDRSFIFTARRPDSPDFTVAWLCTDNGQAAPGLARKLPHYGKYSYLGFSGAEPTNDLKGQWPVLNSPLSYFFKPNFDQAKLSDRKALAELKPVFSEKELMGHIKYLASDELKGRGLGSPELNEAANYIAKQFGIAGLKPGSDEFGWFQTWQLTGGPENKLINLSNVIGYIPGTNPAWNEQSVVVCAHYDHLGLGWPDVRSGNEGQIHNGADDNASGVAVLIELAKNLKSASPQRNIVFVAFTGEEAGLLGSKYYVEHTKRFPASKVIGALNLDTVGRLNGQPILILNGSTASEWVHIFRGIGFVTGIQSKMVKEDLDASDQMSFIEKGVPAVQLFSGPHADYHRPTDDVEKIDAAGLVKVAVFTKEAIAYLADREDFMTVNIPSAKSGHPGGKPSSGKRTASLGTMPDFQYQGEGVRIQAVTPGSAAAKAGLQKGDVLKQLGDAPIKSLRDFSNILKQHQPGDSVSVVFEREGETQNVDVVLGER